MSSGDDQMKKATAKKHILVIDDDPVQLRMIKGFLEDIYEVTLIPSGKTAIEYLIDYSPDLILLDYEMLLYNGPTVLKIIRSKEKSKDIPVFFLTGATDKEIVLECLSYNPAGYMVKPVTKKGLTSKLAEFFDPSLKHDSEFDTDADELMREAMRERIIARVNEKMQLQKNDGDDDE